MNGNKTSRQLDADPFDLHEDVMAKFGPVFYKASVIELLGQGRYAKFADFSSHL